MMQKNLTYQVLSHPALTPTDPFSRYVQNDITIIIIFAAFICTYLS